MRVEKTDSRANFHNPNLGWYFDDVPTLTLAVLGDSVEAVREFVKVILDLSISARIFLLGIKLYLLMMFK